MFQIGIKRQRLKPIKKKIAGKHFLPSRVTRDAHFNAKNIKQHEQEHDEIVILWNIHYTLFKSKRIEK